MSDPTIKWRVYHGGLEVTLEVADAHANVLTLTGILSTREARAAALEILNEQGPCLTYQPPNESMRERMFPYGQTRYKRKPAKPSQGARAWLRRALESHRADDLYAALLREVRDE